MTHSVQADGSLVPYSLPEAVERAVESRRLIERLRLQADFDLRALAGY